MNEEYDEFGNKIEDMENGILLYCCFPNCGCDGERLCMAEYGASDRAKSQNVEGMWHTNNMKSKKAIAELMRHVPKKDSP